MQPSPNDYQQNRDLVRSIYEAYITGKITLDANIRITANVQKIIDKYKLNCNEQQWQDATAPLFAALESIDPYYWNDETYNNREIRDQYHAILGKYIMESPSGKGPKISDIQNFCHRIKLQNESLRAGRKSDGMGVEHKGNDGTPYYIPNELAGYAKGINNDNRYYVNDNRYPSNDSRYLPHSSSNHGYNGYNGYDNLPRRGPPDRRGPPEPSEKERLAEREKALDYMKNNPPSRKNDANTQTDKPNDENEKKRLQEELDKKNAELAKQRDDYDKLSQEEKDRLRAENERLKRENEEKPWTQRVRPEKNDDLHDGEDLDGEDESEDEVNKSNKIDELAFVSTVAALTNADLSACNLEVNKSDGKIDLVNGLEKKSKKWIEEQKNRNLGYKDLMTIYAILINNSDESNPQIDRAILNRALTIMNCYSPATKIEKLRSECSQRMSAISLEKMDSLDPNLMDETRKILTEYNTDGVSALHSMKLSEEDNSNNRGAFVGYNGVNKALHTFLFIPLKFGKQNKGIADICAELEGKIYSSINNYKKFSASDIDANNFSGHIASLTDTWKDFYGSALQIDSMHKEVDGRSTNFADDVKLKAQAVEIGLAALARHYNGEKKLEPEEVRQIKEKINTYSLDIKTKLAEEAINVHKVITTRNNNRITFFLVAGFIIGAALLIFGAVKIALGFHSQAENLHKQQEALNKQDLDNETRQHSHEQTALNGVNKEINTLDNNLHKPGENSNYHPVNPNTTLNDHINEPGYLAPHIPDSESYQAFKYEGVAMVEGATPGELNTGHDAVAALLGDPNNTRNTQIPGMTHQDGSPVTIGEYQDAKNDPTNVYHHSTTSMDYADQWVTDNTVAPQDQRPPVFIIDPATGDKYAYTNAPSWLISQTENNYDNGIANTNVVDEKGNIISNADFLDPNGKYSSAHAIMDRVDTRVESQITQTTNNIDRILEEANFKFDEKGFETYLLANPDQVHNASTEINNLISDFNNHHDNGMNLETYINQHAPHLGPFVTAPPEYVPFGANALDGQIAVAENNAHTADIVSPIVAIASIGVLALVAGPGASTVKQINEATYRRQVDIETSENEKNHKTKHNRGFEFDRTDASGFIDKSSILMHSNNIYDTTNSAYKKINDSKKKLSGDQQEDRQGTTSARAKLLAAKNRLIQPLRL